jgi:hypothetical protein
LHDEDDGEVVIMSTNRNTKKFDMLEKQKGVALLIHDFVPDDNVNGSSKEDAGAGSNNMYSITLNGNCRILQRNDKSEYYRRKHLQHNPEYPQFIVGEDIVMLCVDVSSARICDVQDQVIKWNVQDGIKRE